MKIILFTFSNLENFDMAELFCGKGGFSIFDEFGGMRKQKLRKYFLHAI